MKKKELTPLEAAAWRHASKAIADQTIVHRRETAALAKNYVAMQEALVEAIKTVDWLRAVAVERWTAADAARLAEWRELAR
jgi:hypothetical protein